jgi:hypothetical protein
LDSLYNNFLELLNTQLYKKLEIGDSTVGEVGSKYNATITNDSAGHQYINFDIPKGPVGATGKKGPIGIKGSTGPRGPLGPVGLPGAPC